MKERILAACQVIWQQMAGDGELSQIEENRDRKQLLYCCVDIYKMSKETGYEEKNIN